MSRQYGSDKRIDRCINGTEQRSQKYTHINLVNWSSKEEQGKFNREMTVFSTNGAGTTRNPYAKKQKESRNRPYTFHKN